MDATENAMANVEVMPGAGIADDLVDVSGETENEAAQIAAQEDAQDGPQDDGTAQDDNDDTDEDGIAPAPVDTRLDLTHAEAEAYPPAPWSCVVSYKQLQHAVKHVAAVLDKHSAKPILQDVLLTAGERGVYLYGTDLDIGVVAYVTRAPVSPGGSVVISPYDLPALKRMPKDAEAEISVNGTAVKVTVAGTTAQIIGTEAAEFPCLPAYLAMIPTITVAGDALKIALQRTLVAVSAERARYALNGVLLTAAPDNAAAVELVGTDGYRLAVAQVPATIDAGAKVAHIVPVKAVAAVLRMIGPGDVVKVVLADASFCIEVEDGAVFGRAIDGQFPEYREVMPDPETRLSLWRGVPGVLAAALEACYGLNQHGTVTLESNGAGLHVKAEDPERGSRAADAAGEYIGAPLSPSPQFNAGFLLDALAGFIGKGKDAEAVEFHFFGQGRAAIIRAAGNTAHTHLVMPIVVD